MARALLSHTVEDRYGNVKSGVSITVREPGTSTPIAAVMHTALTGGSVLANPLTTDANGGVSAFLDAQQAVDLYVVDGSVSRTVPAVAISGSGGATPDFTIWSPDAPPLVAGALDDEFQTQGAGVPAGWTEFDPNGVQTVAVDQRGLVLTQAIGSHASGENLTGIYKAIPAGAFTIWAFVSGALDFWNGQVNPTKNHVGLTLWEDAADTAKQIAVLGFWMSEGNGFFDISVFTDYQTFSASKYHERWPCSSFLRIRGNDPDYAFGGSVHGKGEIEIFTTAALGFVPQHVGLSVCNADADIASMACVSPFFRYKASDVGLTGRLDGASVGGFYA